MKARVSEGSGVLGERQGVAAFGRHAAHFFCAEAGSHRIGRAMGMNRPGYEPHHSSMCQSL